VSWDSSSVNRTADSRTRLEQAGLVEVTRVGNQKHYQARRESPIFTELRGLVAKTVGVVEPLRNSLNKKAVSVRESPGLID
jgi:hypothetical protein